MSHDNFLDEAWKKEEGLVKKIVISGSAQELYDSIPNKEKMAPIGGETLEIICMDGRFDERGKDGHVFARDGGQGILRDKDGVEKIADGYVKAALELGVGAIRLTSHGDCGAWGLSGKNQAEGEKYYENLRATLVHQIAVAGLPIKVVLEHIPDDEANKEGRGLCRPHIERAAYYVFAPSFNPQAVAGLPTGFVISREYFTPEYAVTNIAIAIKIAFGGHGFGKRFTAEQPFLLVAVADSEEKSAEAEKELESAKREAMEKYLPNDPEAMNKILATGMIVGS